MEIWLSLVIAVLLVGLTAALVKLFLVKKTAREIGAQLAERIATETNALISVPHRDKTMCELAERLNCELRELRRERRRFQQGDAELKTAITNVSHDLRTPLTAINGYLDLLDDTKKSATVAGYLQIIRNRAEALEQYAEDLFRYLVAVSPEREIGAERVAINNVLEESILGFYAALQKRGITPNISIPDRKIVRNVDKDSLSRVISNLLNNAIKYSDGDLDVTLTDDGEIIVANTAAALTEVDVNRLFDRFYTVENARRSTGLGLSIARTLIEQMNGTISAEHKDGRLIISVKLPSDGD